MIQETINTGKEFCYECGRSVAHGSGWFVNRVVSFDTAQDRKAMGAPFPAGGYICAECDEGLSALSNKPLRNALHKFLHSQSMRIEENRQRLSAKLA